MSDNTKTIVILGDGYVGKTSILNAIKSQKFEDQIPNIYEHFEWPQSVNGKELKFKFIDTAGQEEFAFIRDLSCKEADIFLLCFAVNDRVSFENIETKWLPDLRNYPKIPIVLVGTKSDLRQNSERDHIKKQEIIKLQKASGALFYAECSAKTHDGIENLKKKLAQHFRREWPCVVQ